MSTSIKKRVVALLATLALVVCMMAPAFAVSNVGVFVGVWQVYNPVQKPNYRLNVYVSNPTIVGNSSNVTVYTDDASTRDNTCYFRFRGTESGGYTLETKINPNYSVERWRPTNNCDMYLTSANTPADYLIHIARETGAAASYCGFSLKNIVGTQYMSMTLTSDTVIGGYNVNWQYSDPNSTNWMQLWLGSTVLSNA